MNIFNKQELEPVLKAYTEKLNQRDLKGAMKLNYEIYESVFQGYTKLAADRERFENSIRNVAARAPNKLKEAEKDFGELIETNKTLTEKLLQVLNNVRIIGSKMIDLQLRIEQK